MKNIITGEMTAESIYKKSIYIYDLIEKNCQDLLELIVLLEKNDKIIPEETLNKLSNELRKDQKKIEQKKQYFINTFYPLLKDNEMFYNKYNTFIKKNENLAIDIQESIVKKTKQIKKMRNKLIYLKKINNFFRLLLNCLVSFIIANAFFNFLEISNNTIYLIAGTIVGFLSGYISTSFYYKKNIFEIFSFFSNKKYELNFIN